MKVVTSNHVHLLDLPPDVIMSSTQAHVVGNATFIHESYTMWGAVEDDLREALRGGEGE